jgi:nucleotide-binding universal stress UspA family protein
LRIIDEIPIGVPGFDTISLSSAAPQVLDQIRVEQAHIRHEALEYLEGVAIGLRDRGLRVSTRVVADFDHGAALLKVASEPEFDLVGLETQGRRPIARLAIGSMARKVIHASPIPIFVQAAGKAHASH